MEAFLRKQTFFFKTKYFVRTGNPRYLGEKNRILVFHKIYQIWRLHCWHHNLNVGLRTEQFICYIIHSTHFVIHSTHTNLHVTVYTTQLHVQPHPSQKK